MKKFILVSVIPHTFTKEQAEDDLMEAHELIKTLGTGEVVQIIQKRMHPDPGTYVGSGKAEEIAAEVRAGRADVIIINAVVQSRQLYNILTLFWNQRPDGQVWDRVDLILEVFKKHAKTAESKLQIELAQVKHMGPRMYGLGGVELSRQGGGIGTKGIGETNIERMRRHWKEAIRRTEKQLRELESVRMKQMMRRKELGLKTISIVGYTNAGKSTLYNKLTKKQKLVKDALFATLDSSVGKIYFAHARKEALLSDTIGFIQKLPPSLIKAFKSTLMESVHADILLHVTDGSDPKFWEKVHIVDTILRELEVKAQHTFLVVNKIDKETSLTASDLHLLKTYNDETPTHFISAATGEGVGNLLQDIEQRI